MRMERIESFSVLQYVNIIEGTDRQTTREKKRRTLYIYLDYLYLRQDFRLKIVDNGRDSDDQG
jgi:hypothetical protein